MVQRRGSHAHTDIRWPLHLRHRQIVAELELVQAAVGGDRQAFHEMGTVILRAFDHAY